MLVNVIGCPLLGLGEWSLSSVRQDDGTRGFVAAYLRTKGYVNVVVFKQRDMSSWTVHELNILGTITSLRY